MTSRFFDRAVTVRCTWQCLLVIAATFFAPALSHAVEPAESLDRPWLVTSLLGGSRLANRNIFDIAFERERENPAAIAAIWVASSDGLHRYDGYRWRRYGKEDGLPSNFVRCVLVTHDGTIWVGTAEGAGIFDGSTFSRHGSNTGLAGQNVRRIVEDPDGSLWFCSDSWPRASGSGGLAALSHDAWHSWRRADGLPSEYVVNYFRASDGRQFVATAAGLVQMQNSQFTQPLKAIAKPGLNWGSAAFAETPDRQILVSTGTHVFLNKDGRWHPAVETLRHENGIVTTADGKILGCVAKGPNQRFFAEWTGTKWNPVSTTFPVTHDYVEDLREAPDGSVFAIGFDCLRRWQRRGSEWRVFSGMPRPVFADNQGAVWSMDARGFYQNSGNQWHSLGAPQKSLVTGANGTWGWSAKALVNWSAKALVNWSAPVPTPQRLPIATVQAVTLDAQGNPWAFGRDGMSHQHLMHFNGARWSETVIPESLWLAGAADPTTGMWYLAGEKDGGHQLLRIHLNTDHAGVKSFPVPPALISQYANSLYADRQGNVWLFGDTGLHRWREDHPGRWETISTLPGSSVAGCVERSDALWFIVDGTLGGRSGLASFAKGKWKTVDVDPVFSWSLAPNGELLLGSKSKFYVLPMQAGVDPITVRLPEPEPVIGILRDRSGVYWLGTPQGTFLFKPVRATPDTVVVASDSQVIEGDRFRDRVRGVSRFQPSAPAQNFSFSWRVDNGPWSPFNTQAEHTFSSHGYSLGDHRLLIRVRDNSMNLDPTPAEVDFRVLQLPLQGHRWFWPALVALGILLTALTVVAVAARYKLSQQAAQLEQMVEARTAELQLRESQLRQSNRALRRTNDDLRQFSWAASHDLKEPLRMVVTYTQFLAKRYTGALDDTGRQFMSYAVEGALRTQSLLQALLEYWQVSESGDEAAAASVDAGVTLRKALGNLEIMMLESGATVTFKDLPTVEASEIALMQVFQNLVSNAIKYSKPGQLPLVDVTAQPATDSGWHFRVMDNGIGIAPEHLDLIFKLFKRLNGNRYAGAGVGLALCAKIVENFGGRIWVESQLGIGSTFHFTLPDRRP